MGLQKQFTFQASFITIAASAIIPGCNYEKQCEKAKLDVKFKTKTKFYTFQRHNCCFFPPLSLSLFCWIVFGRFRRKLLRPNGITALNRSRRTQLIDRNVYFFVLFKKKKKIEFKENRHDLYLCTEIILITGAEVDISINFSLAAAAEANIIKSRNMETTGNGFDLI